MKIIIVHRGNQKYLNICINTAKKYGNDVVIIGDKSNSKYDSRYCSWCDSDSLKTERLEQFDKVYKHMSPNRYNFEKICFERYYLIWEYMRKNELSECIMMDSDVLVYTDVNKLDFSDYAFGVSYEKKYECASPHFSYWTFEAIDDFTRFIIDIYEKEIEILEEKWNRHVTCKIPGGICDMTLLYHYVNRNRKNYLNIESLDSLNHFNGMIDNQLDEDYYGEIKMKKDEKYGIRMLKKKDSSLYYTSEDGTEYKILTIHAQGVSKQYMHALARCHKDSFSMLVSKTLFWIEKAFLKIKRKLVVSERYN